MVSPEVIYRYSPVHATQHFHLFALFCMLPIQWVFLDFKKMITGAYKGLIMGPSVDGVCGFCFVLCFSVLCVCVTVVLSFCTVVKYITHCDACA